MLSNTCGRYPNDFFIILGRLHASAAVALLQQGGLLLPPHGMLLMTMKGVAPPQVTMAHIFQAVTPYVLMSIVVLILVFFIPAVAVWLPGLIG